MNVSQLKPASEIAKVYGVKGVIYGGPGTGKTPIMLTAPNAVGIVSEPGMLSIRHSNMPIWTAETYIRIKEFFDWVSKSNEPRQYFQTICVDSGSQMAEIILKEEQAANKDGRRAYMMMSQKVMAIFDTLYYLQGMNVFIICKEGNFEDNGMTKFRPFFPGQDLYVKTPHLYDEIFRIEDANIGGQMRKAFRTKNAYNCIARDRIGKLNEVEPTDLAHIISKSLS